jgi:protein-disulfide isomerase
MSQSKRQLRAQRAAVRQAAEQAAAAATTRRRRLIRLGSVAGLAAIIVAIGVAVSSSGGASAPAPASAAVVNAANVVKGIPEHNGVLGNPNAPLTVTEYIDLQCPICAAASKQALPTLIKDYVRTGKVKLQARTLSFLGPDSVRAAQVAAGAKQQGRLWPFVESFYAAQGTENSGYVTDAFLRSVASASGVNADAALRFAGTQAAQDQLDGADAAAQALKINATPSFTVRRGSGVETVLGTGLQDPATLGAALDKALAK